MIELNCKGGSSEFDLEAFRLLKPIAGNFKTLTALKHVDGIMSDTRIEFEHMTMHFSNLNIGDSGYGSGCMAGILTDLGMDKDAMTNIVERRCKTELLVVGNDVTKIR